MANGINAIELVEIASKNINGVVLDDWSKLLRITSDPKIKVGMYIGKTIIDKRRPPRLTPKVREAAKEPITDRAGVPASRDKIIQIIEFIGTP